MFAAGKTKGASASAAANYIESCFSTYLYTGNGSTQTITNGIDLAGKGGLVWLKSRSNATDHRLVTTTLGANNDLSTDLTAGLDTNNIINAFNSNGFTLNTGNDTNVNAYTYASWTFRKQPKFFDVVTWTGNGTNQTVNHSLGSFPGCIIYKRTDAASDWFVSTRNASGNWEFLKLNTTAASVASVDPTTLSVTSTSFDPYRLWGNVNGATYVAYLFAHNAGGFGLTGTDNVISCGSFTTDASGQATVTLGYEPQWVMRKTTATTGNWIMADTMREMSVTNTRQLSANLSNAESSANVPVISPTATGFFGDWLGANTTYIYIAIRRGPMKVPTDGTKMFSSYASSGVVSAVPTGFPSDMQIQAYRPGGVSWSPQWASRLTGRQYLVSSSTSAEATTTIDWGSNTSVIRGVSANRIYYDMQRAPGFFDEVCFNGVDSGTKSVSHNLQAVPELIITKARNDAVSWYVYSATLGINKWLRLNATDAEASSAGAWGSTPTASAFTATTTILASSATNYVAYLFATCAGVSKVGSYTGNGTTQTIDCGFTGGARFVLIKRTDSTGDWYVYDTARGMTTLTDPYLLLNSTAAESATLGSVTTVTIGFAVNASILAAINTNAASYIYLAIA